MTAAPSIDGLRLSAYETDSLAGIREHIHALHLDEDGAAERLDEAARRPEFVLVTAALDARLVGYAAASEAERAVRLDPVVLSPALSRLDADRVGRRLVEAALRTHERPWARVSVHPSSPAVGVLLRDGWRPVKASPLAAYLLLSGADARP